MNSACGEKTINQIPLQRNYYLVYNSIVVFIHQLKVSQTPPEELLMAY